MSQGVIALFTPEIAIRRPDGTWLKNYTGGLGTFGGAFLAAAHALRLPLVAVTPLPTLIYHQRVGSDGKMYPSHESWNFRQDFEEVGMCDMPIAENPRVHVKLWRLPEGKYGTVPVIGLDTDHEWNDELSRTNTRYLYAGSTATGKTIQRAIAHSLIFGRGGVIALNTLGIKPSRYHLNESHAAPAGIELLRQALETQPNLELAIESVRQKMVFTTHTPVGAGNPSYNIDEMLYLGAFGSAITRPVLARLGGDPYFSFVATCLRLSRDANAVSERHLKKALEMHAHIADKARLISITNGAHQDDWQPEDFRNAKDPASLREANRKGKRNLLDFIGERTGKYWSEGKFTIVWARRFTEYKRPGLLFRHAWEWIERELRNGRIQLIVAGKPHPDEELMVNEWNWLNSLSWRFTNLAVIPDYDLETCAVLKRGADLWLNTPLPPNEACGTSGMGAALCGARNCSTKDGWMWEEAERCPGLYFFFGSDAHGDPSQGALDAKDLCRVLETEAIPCFYDRPDEWYALAFQGKERAEKQYSSVRMVAEYAQYLYHMRLD